MYFAYRTRLAAAPQVKQTDALRLPLTVNTNQNISKTPLRIAALGIRCNSRSQQMKMCGRLQVNYWIEDSEFAWLHVHVLLLITWAIVDLTPCHAPLHDAVLALVS